MLNIAFERKKEEIRNLCSFTSEISSEENIEDCTFKKILLDILFILIVGKTFCYFLYLKNFVS